MDPDQARQIIAHNDLVYWAIALVAFILITKVIELLFFLDRKFNKKNGDADPKKPATLEQLREELAAIGETSVGEVKATVFSGFQELRREMIELVTSQKELAKSTSELTATVKARHELDMEKYRLRMISRRDHGQGGE